MTDDSRAEATPSTNSRLWFDPQDYKLLGIVNDVLERSHYRGWKRLLASYLHPHGIKELAAGKGLRIAYAVVHLLGSLEKGQAGDRLEALRSLRDEVLNAASSSLQRNTARVLLQIMKELVRAKDDPDRQLMLARDFRSAIAAPHETPVSPQIRRELKKYHLLEMSEEWNQLASDDHVHDANSKGRKSPTHLIMDAWIKGIRTLTVVHYNFVQPEAAAELLEAAEIMGIKARIGIELRVRYRQRYVKLIWTPAGLTGSQEMLSFLQRPAVARFMDKGREVSAYQQRYVWDVLDNYNKRLRHELGREFGVEPPAIERRAFLDYVGVGQPTVHHLGHYIWTTLAPSLGCDGSEASELRAECLRIDADHISQHWLGPDNNPEIHNPFRPDDAPDLPELLRMTAGQLGAVLAGLHDRNSLTLDLAGLSLGDVLCLLADGDGAISHLEVFNLRSHELGRRSDLEAVLQLIQAINGANVVLVKRAALAWAETARQALTDAGSDVDAEADLADLEGLLERIPEFVGRYRKRHLGTRLGSDSTGNSLRHRGMGLVVADTLPARARRELRSAPDQSRLRLPLSVEVSPAVTFNQRSESRFSAAVSRALRHVPGLMGAGYDRSLRWVKGKYRLAPEGGGNIVTLGGIAVGGGTEAKRRRPEGSSPGLRYLNSRLKIALKIFFGFVPASLSFALTKDWWLLAWLGPVIWFGITGVRNIIQSVLGSGGFKRSRLLRWNSYVSWSRLADSLFFTGFSVPLLDWLTKSVLLDQGLGVNTHSDPMLLYTIMAVVNGIYISTHNTLRGLPRKAIVGNFFRSVLSIPLAVAFNWGVGGLMALGPLAGNTAAIDSALQKWAAIISKFASDCVAGVIEGLADRSRNIMLRTRDLEEKLRQLFETYARLETLFPQESVLELFESPKAFIDSLAVEQQDMDKVVIVNALDFMYFWMYQPRARLVLSRMLRAMTPDERRVFLLSQYVLRREKEISLLLVDGLVGKTFNRALAFYLDYYNAYLDDIQALAARL